MNTLPATVHTLPAAAFATGQRRHFVLAVALPTLLAVAGALWAPELLALQHLPQALALLLGMWFVVGGIGVSVGLHRHFSHRSFEARPALRVVLGICGQMAVQGPIVYWVALHRLHHASSDRPGDPHSPQAQDWPSLQAQAWPSLHGQAWPSLQGHQAWPRPRAARAAWQGHLAWVWSHNVPKPTRYSRELLVDALVRRLCRAYPACVALGLLLPAAVAMAWLGGWQGALFGAYWGGVVRIALGHHVIWSINSICHLFGRRPSATGDHSGNVGWLALLSFGESWHNNHHDQPTSARFGRGWRQPDIGWAVVKLAIWLGWARLRVARSGPNFGPNFGPTLDPATAQARPAEPDSGAATGSHRHP